MSKSAEIQEQLEDSRARLLEILELLPDEALLEAGALDHLSVADFLALLTAWEAELLTGLMRLNQGKKPEKLLAALDNPDYYDSLRLAENKGRDLDSVFDDFQQVRMQLESWLEEFSDRDLTARKRYKWLKGKSLAQLIASTTYQKESRRFPDLETFARKWNSPKSNNLECGQTGGE